MYSWEAKDVKSTDINDLAASDNNVQSVGRWDLQNAFSILSKRALSLPHPGERTAWVLAPESQRQFPMERN